MRHRHVVAPENQDPTWGTNVIAKCEQSLLPKNVFYWRQKAISNYLRHILVSLDMFQYDSKACVL